MSTHGFSVWICGGSPTIARPRQCRARLAPNNVRPATLWFGPATGAGGARRACADGRGAAGTRQRPGTEHAGRAPLPGSGLRQCPAGSVRGAGHRGRARAAGAGHGA
ncbi:hypothetical protein [Lysobacter gummosus]|uniref:hypothetical protein n=1 Tax=Lysobacter gummosus TaxID=262324 RepID=UPI00362FB20E